MNVNHDPEGEYTDAEPSAGSTETHNDETQAEGEYTDSDTPNEDGAESSPTST